MFECAILKLSLSFPPNFRFRSLVMSISVLDVQHINLHKEKEITFPFKQKEFKLQQEEEGQQYNPNESSASNMKGGKSFDENRSIVSSMLSTDYSSSINSISLPWSALKKNMNHKGFGKAVFFTFKDIGDIFETTKNEPSTSSGVLISHIISASLGRGHNTDLDSPEFRK